MEKESITVNVRRELSTMSQQSDKAAYITYFLSICLSFPLPVG
jgi:hypothetical protein